MAATREQVVIADYDYGDVDIERAIIEQAGFELIAAHCKTEDEVIEAAHDAAAVVAQYATISARVIDALPACRAIARYGTGVDIVDVDAATRHNILVDQRSQRLVRERSRRSCDGSPARGGAQDQRLRPGDARRHLAMAIRSTDSPPARERPRAAVVWRHRQAIAARATGFGMRITAHDPYLPLEEMTAAGAEAMSFDDLVTESDCLVIQAPLTPQTHHLFDEVQLRRMKPTSILINTARGPIVDDRALHRALSEGWIAGAGLDDIEEEPAKVRDWRPDDPLFSLDNVVITPHAAYYSEEAIATVRHFAAEEVVRVLTGQGPLSPVNAGELVDARWSRSP